MQFEFPASALNGQRIAYINFETSVSFYHPIILDSVMIRHYSAETRVLERIIGVVGDEERRNATKCGFGWKRQYPQVLGKKPNGRSAQANQARHSVSAVGEIQGLTNAKMTAVEALK
ncbi:hypothetical protein AJ78_00672 [Emergomyces pasteurianus Ep9510]|uniref:Uncharacterized protein n=1 Tax=Emergomyces pasteurianus Ep9510 TaxID=1447872 RepID=A0A1J9PU29_9EURO|nr:hypothetical protein AJ78_00672 [Emergomyces pasteurianus Ep9510]